MAGDLQDLKAQLANCMADLDAMPRRKAFTEWHADRVREAEWLTRTIARLERSK